MGVLLTNKKYLLVIKLKRGNMEKELEKLRKNVEVWNHYLWVLSVILMIIERPFFVI